MIRLLFSLCILFSTSIVMAAPLVQVDFQEQSGTMYFTFNTSDQTSLSKDNITFKVDKKDRITFTVDGYKTKRAWKNKWRSRYIKRTLLHSSKSRNLSYLKVRMKKKVPNDTLKYIQVTQKDKSVEVLIPYSTASKRKARADQKVEAVAQDEPTQDEPTQDEPAQDEPAQDEPIQNEPVQDAEDPSNQDLPKSHQEALLKSCKGYEGPDRHAPNTDEIHKIYSELALSQMSFLEEYSEYPRILGLPVHLINPKDAEALQHIPELSTHLLDEEMHHRAEVIWIDDQHVRNHSKHLADQNQALSVAQSKSLAALSSANFVLQTGVCRIPHRADLLGLHAQLRNASDGQVVHRSNYYIQADVMNRALQKTLVQQTRKGALWRSALFPGWGHVYRGKQSKGWSYITAGVILAGAAITSSILGYQANQDYLDNDPSTTGRRSDANAHYDRANYLWVGLATLWGVAMSETYIEAEDQVNFKDPYLILSNMKETP